MTDEYVAAIFHGYYLVDYPDELGRIATHYRVRLHVLGNDSAGCHHGIFAHGHAWQNGCSCTNPRLSANVNRLAHQHMSVVKIVVIADELHVGGNHRTLVDGYSATAHHQAIVHDERTISDFHMMEAHTRKSWHNANASTNMITEQLLYQSVVLLRIRHRLVQSEQHLCLSPPSLISSGVSILESTLISSIILLFF